VARAGDGPGLKPLVVAKFFAGLKPCTNPEKRTQVRRQEARGEGGWQGQEAKADGEGGWQGQEAKADGEGGGKSEGMR
jgi:hypothetical protein